MADDIIHLHNLKLIKKKNYPKYIDFLIYKLWLKSCIFHPEIQFFMIQFDYEHHTYFGEHLKVIIEDGVLKYCLYTVNFPGKGHWITLEVDEDKLRDFIQSLENLEGCMDDYRLGSPFNHRQYTLICNTEDIKKKIRGVDDYQIPVQLCMVKMANLHPELEEVYRG
jgi:hypothetical protein